MRPLSLPRPAGDESAPFYHGYIEKVPGEQIGEYLAAQLGEVERLLAPLDDAAACFRYAPDKWSVKEVLGHLCDAERIFSYRLLRIARADATPLPGFDQNAYVPPADFDARPLAELLREFQAIRASTITLVEGLPSAGWERRGQASGRPISTRALAYIMVGHVTHHLGVLRDRYRVSSSPDALAAV
jgi:DinB superfamily